MDNKAYFNSISEQWDEMQRSFFSVNVRETAFSKAVIEKNRLAADVGCGTGFITEGLVAYGVNVIAIDHSEKMIGEMKQKFPASADITYRLGESDRLPLHDNEVDYVFANMFLHHTKDPLAAIKEMTRGLKSGGKILITDMDRHNFEFLTKEQHDEWMGFDRDEIRRWYSQAGLKNIDIDYVGENCCATSECGSEKANISIFYAYGEK